MATRDVSISLGDEETETVKSFDAFKTRHGFKYDWEVLASCFTMIKSLDEYERSVITFLQNGDASITLNEVSSTGQMTQTNINFVGVTKRSYKD